MTNLSKFLSEIAWGLYEQATAISGDDPAAETPTSLALRDYGSQLLAVADVAGENGSIEWSRLVDRIGVDLEPEPGLGPLIGVAFDQGDVERRAHEADGAPETHRIVVLHDGETYGPLLGSKVCDVPPDFDDEQIEEALAEGSLTEHELR
jgi:hypothetical protein